MVKPLVDIHLDTSDWYRVKGDLDEFDPKLSLALRRHIRMAGERTIERIKSKLRESTPEGNPGGPGREALIAGTRMTVSFSRRMAGARLVTSGSRLPAGHEALLKVYNMASFRHPVFETNRQAVTRAFTSKESARRKRQRVASGETAAWVTEHGNPYFGKVINETLDASLYRDINVALDEAIAAIGGRGL